MKASLLYRAASVLIVLFAVGHTVGFRQVDPRWGINDLIARMQSSAFTTQGFQRTYWDFYVGFGLFVSVFLLLAAVLAWQLGGLSAPTYTQMRWVAWMLTFSFAAVCFLSWRCFFMAPLIFTLIITLCLLAANLLSPRSLDPRSPSALKENLK